MTQTVYVLFYYYINILKKGNWVALKNSPAVEEIYLRKVNEYSPDLIVVLDKPILNKEFVEKVSVPIAWIDHHPPHPIKGVKYFNPRILNKNDNRPTTYWCYKIVNENLLLATLGIISDYSLATIEEFQKKYPNLIKKNIVSPGTVLFDTEFGKLIRIYNFLLKGKVSDVRKRISMLIKLKDPYEILNQTTPKGKHLYKIYEKLNKKYIDLLEKAEKTKSRGKLLVFTYVLSNFSFTGGLANELMYKNPDKIILVAREYKEEMKLSMRNDDKSKIKVSELIKKALKGVEGYGGGHEHAVGGNIEKKDFIKFIENLENLIK